MSSEESLDELRRLVLSRANAACMRVFIAGDRATVGKTSICLALLGYLREQVGIRAKDLCYIKPATQSEAFDKVHQYCKQEGIECIGGSSAPIVFYSGFTRSVIQGQTKVDLDRVGQVIDELCLGKTFCIIDGVGFPGVGSCVGASNADIAKIARAPVVLVAKSGVGAAIDAHCLNAALFEQAQVPVLGALFNRAPLDGFYAKKTVEPVIQEFFKKHRVRESCYGIIPTLHQLEEENEDMQTLITTNIQHVTAHADLANLFLDACLDAFNHKREKSSFEPKREQNHISITREAIESAVLRDHGIVHTGG